MRKTLMCALLAAALCLICVGALASGATVRTLTPFADVDFAAQTYMDVVTSWEEATGNLVEDYSGLIDEDWLARMLDLIGEGEADLLIVPVGSGLTSQQVVTAQELAQGAPQLGARSFAAMAEADGSVLLTPVRLNWEALYVNEDMLSAAGLSVPSTFDELLTVCAALSQKGITPIANALCEWSEITLDCVALIGAPAEMYGSEQSRAGAKDALAALVAVGAFGQDPWNAGDEETEALFLSGQAAMRFDSDALAQRVSAERTANVRVVNIGGSDGQARTAIVGMPSFGLTISRACWDDPARREAALSLAAELLGGESSALLSSGVEGALGESIAAMTASATDCTGLLYDRDPDGFDAWAESVIASLMGQ